MDLSVVIPTWKGRELLEAYLPSVDAAVREYRQPGGRATEIIVVEDAGGDGTPRWLRDNHPGIRLIEHDRNRGFCAACQSGFEAARFPLVLLLNNDVRLKPGCIAPMAGHFTDASVFAVTGKLLNQAEDQFCNGGKVACFRRGMWSTYQNYDVMPGADAAQPLLSFTAIGAFSLYDRAKFLDLSGFDPLTAMVEDVELSYRAWKRGWLVRYEPRGVACHDASQTMGRRYGRRSLDKVSRRSRILMHWMLLHDPRMFRKHQLLIAARLLTGWLALDYRFYWAVATGLANLPAILEKRRAARKTMRRTDRELLDMLQHFYRTAPIVFH
ncbi:MAG: putative glycosyltransferase [Acidobacteria bacterium]|jgi:GT2 family glycosyltransferase|nr:putative glycosyltransferase [Acidobacteriota bacterium]